jgi:Zn finger protein HypA/HybF involved in hydrogenase expression
MAQATFGHPTKSRQIVMSDFKFSCPSCQQHIECDRSHSSMEIDCPNCTTKMTVPSVEVADEDR